MKAELNVSGMKCGGCETNVQDTVSALAGVQSVKVFAKESRAEVEFDESKVSLDAIKQAIKGKGFQVA